MENKLLQWANERQEMEQLLKAKLRSIALEMREHLPENLIAFYEANWWTSEVKISEGKDEAHLMGLVKWLEELLSIHLRRMTTSSELKLPTWTKSQTDADLKKYGFENREAFSQALLSLNNCWKEYLTVDCRNFGGTYFELYWFIKLPETDGETNKK